MDNASALPTGSTAKTAEAEAVTASIRSTEQQHSPAGRSHAVSKCHQPPTDSSEEAGKHTPIQRCQVHKARNITDRLAKPLHASVRKTLRQAWELNDADKAERLIKNLARRLEHDYPGVSGSILEGIDEILTVTRLGLPVELRRSLACTNIIENMNGTIRQVCRNVKRWRDTRMALRWTGAAMQEAAKGFRRLKAHKQLPALRAALLAHQVKHSINPDLEQQAKAA